MKNGVFLTLCVSVCLSGSLVSAQADPMYSSIESDANTYLTGENGSDESFVLDEQDQTIDPLEADAVVGFTNSNGTFSGSVSGDATFSDSNSGSFFASTQFQGTDSGSPDAMGQFGHTFSSQFEYRFVVDSEGTLEIDGTLFNSDTVFESFVRVAVSSEFVQGGGFSGNFFDQNVLDTQNVGTLKFGYSVPLNAASGSYRLRLFISTSGQGQREQSEVLSSLTSSFEIQVQNPCPADLSGDGMLDFFDVSAFLTAFSSMDPVADFNNDGAFDFFDVSVFLSEFAAGCP